MAAAPDVSRLRATIVALQDIERPPASDGERRAAEWIRDALAQEGADARIEAERSTGSFWLPLGLLNAAAALAGWVAPRAVAGAVGAAAAAAVIDDVSSGRRGFRRLLPARTTHNVVAELGDSGAERILVFTAHHDAAPGGRIYDMRAAEAFADRFPRFYARINASPRAMLGLVAGPALVAAGALSGRRGVRRAGSVIATGSVATMADIARSPIAPGANDNLTAVATLLELARLLRDEPLDGVRVILLSTGSEESLLEGMRGFARRHFPALPRERTRFVVVESVGSPQLIVIEGEGMVRRRDYPAASRAFLAACADRAGAPLRRGLRLGFATDGLIPLKAGYDTAVLASVNKYKWASNYHQPWDRDDRVDFDSVAGAVSVCREVVRASAPAPARSPARVS